MYMLGYTPSENTDYWFESKVNSHVYYFTPKWAIANQRGTNLFVITHG